MDTPEDVAHGQQYGMVLVFAENPHHFFYWWESFKNRTKITNYTINRSHATVIVDDGQAPRLIYKYLRDPEMMKGYDKYTTRYYIIEPQFLPKAKLDEILEIVRMRGMIEYNAV